MEKNPILSFKIGGILNKKKKKKYTEKETEIRLAFFDELEVRDV